MSLVLVAVIAMPALAGIAVLLPGGRRAVRMGPVAASLSLALAALLTVEVASGGPVSALIKGPGGRPIAGLYADRLGVVLLLLVCAVSATVQAFARRYLTGDARDLRFFGAAGLLTAATAATVTAATLVGLALAWSLSGASLCLLLGMYRGLPAAAEGVRRTARAFFVGDAVLWLAVGLATATWGSLDLRTLGTRAEGLDRHPVMLTLVACLLVVAALARSAQLPFHRWLPATLAAPTPVSALLHAGVVNAGGILLVRLSPLFGASRPAGYLAFVAGAATLLYGTQLMLVKNDVKGALAHSTMGQMGFMIMTCGVGALAAAIFHLVAHGMYKAALFLGSGSAVSRHARHEKSPPVQDAAPARRLLAGVLAVFVPTLAIGIAIAIVHPQLTGVRGSVALLVFAWGTGARIAWGWLARGVGPGRVLTLALLSTLGAAAYLALLEAVTGFLAPALVVAGAAPASPLLLAPVIALLALATLMRSAPGWSGLTDLRKTAYVLSLQAGQVLERRRPRRLRAPLLGSSVLTAALQSEGSRP